VADSKRNKIKILIALFFPEPLWSIPYLQNPLLCKNMTEFKMLFSFYLTNELRYYLSGQAREN